MFEREIKFIYDFNLNKINRLGPYFTFEQLTGTDIHPAILHYISAEIDYLVFEDRQNLLKNSVFDYSGEKINYHFNQITAELKRAKRFSAEYITKLILHACSFTINYLIRPKWTLAKFVFDEADIKSTNEIKQILNYIYYYKYLTKILISYINAKKILSMNREEFEALLNKADALGTESYLSAIISNALKSMAEFFNIGEIKKFRVPLPAVELFLEEKELLKHLDILNAEFGDDENSKFNMYDYLKALNKVMIEKKEEEPPVQEQVQFEGEQEVKDTTGETIKEPATQEIKIEETVTAVHDDEHEHDIEEEQAEEVGDIEHKPGLEIKQPARLRIHVDEDNRIEPILEEEKVPVENENVIENDLETKEEIVNAEKNDVPDEESFEEETLFEKDDLNEENLENKNSEVAEESIQNYDTPDEVEPENETAEEETSNEEITVSKNGIASLKEIINVEYKDEPENESMFDILKKNSVQPQQPFPKLDLAELLERKEMTKIIETIFDYDIEDFANTMEEISQCRNYEDARIVLNRTLINRHISHSSKKAETFRTIISEFFEHR